jgi:acylphosphatase
VSQTGKRMRVKGRVQGVFFRNWTVEQARSLGVTGWVRNRADGSVEILAFGPDEQVRALIERCREGPPSAVVQTVEVEEADEPAPADFSKRPTA